jgi:sodium/potassium-transporting ATPase subunit alpha
VERKSKEGKNVISPPPTQYYLTIDDIWPNSLIKLIYRYWKKALNYVFGGFNFLMWIAFIVTIVCPTNRFCDSDTVSSRNLAVL